MSREIRLQTSAAHERAGRAGPLPAPGAVVPESVHTALASPPSRFAGHDFSRVRVHTGPAAERSAREVGARAYTVGTHVVLGAGQDRPEVLAHELNHVTQQRENPGPAQLQRLGLSDVLEAGSELIGGPLGSAASGLVRANRQFLDDLGASVVESPRHVAEFFQGDLRQAIKDHWLQITVVTGGLLAAEWVIGVLAAVPEPTLLTKVVAAILQIVVLAVLGYFAAAEVYGAFLEGRNWLATAKRAAGRPEVVTEASRSFVRMVWHIVMAVLATAGFRARVRARVKAPVPPAPSGPRAAPPSSAGGGEVVPIARHPRFRPAAPAEPAGSPRPAAFGPGGTARRLLPEELADPPALPAPAPVPTPTPGPAPASLSSTGPQPLPPPVVPPPLKPEKKKRPPFVLRLPRAKSVHLALYRSWLGRLQSDPDYERDNPAQEARWRQAHRIGGSHGIPARIYDRGHALGLTGRDGEARVRKPHWTRTRTTPMEVDHIIELQVAPPELRVIFDDVDNYELLDRDANGDSGRRLFNNIRNERLNQAVYDPSTVGRVLIFDAVEVDGGIDGERWSSEEIRAGEHLDYYDGPASDD
jgi:hypothetical protein